MKLKPEALRELILEEMGRLILEQPEDEDAAKGDEEAAGEEAAGEGETVEDEEPEQAEEDAQEEEPEKPDLEPEDKFMAGHSIDKALENVMGDYEERALTNESTKFSLKLLFEKSELPKIDISQFASDVARLINNYEYLLDMEAIIFNKAENFLLDKYGPDVATEFVDEMKDHHDIDFSRMPTEKEHHYTVTGAPGGSDVGYTGGTE